MIRKLKAQRRGILVRTAGVGASSAAMVWSTGCSRTPSFNILGSVFPAWIVCGLIGIVLTAGARFLFVRTKFEQELSPIILVYPCLAALFTFTLWLVFFS